MKLRKYEQLAQELIPALETPASRGTLLVALRERLLETELLGLAYLCNLALMQNKGWLGRAHVLEESGTPAGTQTGEEREAGG